MIDPDLVIVVQISRSISSKIRRSYYARVANFTKNLLILLENFVKSIYTKIDTRNHWFHEFFVKNHFIWANCYRNFRTLQTWFHEIYFQSEIVGNTDFATMRKRKRIFFRHSLEELSKWYFARIKLEITFRLDKNSCLDLLYILSSRSCSLQINFDAKNCCKRKHLKYYGSYLA